MPKSLQDLIKANDDAMATLTTSVSRLEALRSGSTLAERARFNAQIVRAHADLTNFEIVNAHLRAANVVVKPMSNELEVSLTSLADKLDNAIKTNAIVTAALDTIKDLIDTAEKVSQIVDDHHT